MSPGVERAVAGGRQWAERLGSDSVRLTHLLLALLDEDEGRPAVLLEAVGLDVAGIRDRLRRIFDSPIAPPETTLFSAARDWSLANRHDPEFLTDAFLLAVLRADAEFALAADEIGLDAKKLEVELLRRDTAIADRIPSSGHPFASFALPDITVEMEVARVLDANFNRARESLRILDDYCRFVLEDSFLTQCWKELRHLLGDVESRFPPRLLLGARDTVRDVGTSVTASGEYIRDSASDVANLNLKRLEESLRSLEEYGKVVRSDLGREIESLRYRVYTLERAVIRRVCVRERLVTCKLYVLLTGADCHGALDWTIAQVAAGGAGAVQLREKRLSDRELVARARDVRTWTQRAGVLFVINDRPDLARLVGADGVHLGQDDLSVKDARRIVGPDLVIGVSTHTVEQVRAAVLDGADYLGVGPVFVSQTKAFDRLPGLAFVREASRETSLPAFALGGITLQNVGEVVDAGAKRIAVAAAVEKSDDPEQAARQLLAKLERSEQPAE